MTDVSGIGRDNSTQNTTKLNNNNSNNKSASNDSGSVFDSALTESTANFTKGLLTGDLDICKLIDDLNKNIQSAVIGVAKSKLVSMLLGGNDMADATADKAKTATHATKGTAIITKLQKELIGGALEALQQLLTTGQIDMETYAKSLMNSMIDVGVQGAAAEVLGEDNNKLAEENEDLEGQLKDKLEDKKMTMEKDEEGKMIFKDSSGNQIDLDSLKEDDELKGFVDKINANNTVIKANKETLIDTSQMIDSVTNNVSQGIQDVVTGGKDLGTALSNMAANMISDGVSKLTNSLMDNLLAPLQADAVTAGINAGTDGAAAAAAPGIAAAETAGTFGFGSGHASTILANGVADGAAAAVRTLTGSSALGGIVGGLATGKSLAQVLSNVVSTQAREFVNSKVQEGVNFLTEPLRDTADTEIKNNEDRKNKYGIETDEKDKA